MSESTGRSRKEAAPRTANKGKSIKPSTKTRAAATKSSPPKPRPRRPRPSAEALAASQKPVSGVTDAAFRLVHEVRPLHYHVHLLPDLVRGTFRGEVAIDLEVKRQTTSVELHAADLILDHAQVERRDDKGERPATPARRFGVAAPDPYAPQPSVAIVPHGARETVGDQVPASVWPRTGAPQPRLSRHLAKATAWPLRGRGKRPAATCSRSSRQPTRGASFPASTSPSSRRASPSRSPRAPI